MTRRRLEKAIILVVAFLSFLGGMGHVHAATKSWHTFITTIDTQKTWVTVIRHGSRRPPKSGETWQQWGNTSNDTYLFAFGIPSQVRLIMAFSRIPGHRVQAAFYTNHAGKQPIHYRLVGGHLKILSAHGYPYLVLKTRHGGWLDQGKTNYNLNLWVDGLSSLGPQKLTPNGHPNALIRIGQKVPGVPQWQTSQLLYNPHKSWGYKRFGAELRMPNAPPFKTMPPLMPDFPYFNIGNGRFDWYVANPNPLYFNLPASQLLIAPFVGFENSGNYQINSLQGPPHVDFESPFGFYNFVPKSRFSQLVIRSESFGRHDGLGPSATAGQQRTSFRYSWAGPNPDLWSYSLQLAGTMPLNNQVHIGGVTIDSIGPKALPSWVTRQRWPLVAFVQAMHGYSGSEGIYEYTPQIPQAWSWLLGGTAAPASYWQHPYLSNQTGTVSHRNRHPGETLASGFRGEYNAADFRPPMLYISPIDGLVHLAWAKAGVWNLGNGWYVRTESLNQGPYFDSWKLKHLAKMSIGSRAQHGTTVQAVYDLGKYLVFSGNHRVVIRHVSKTPAPVVLSPPTNATAWKHFNRITKHAGVGRSPRNELSWLSAIPGLSVAVPDASITHMSFAGHAFHMTMTVKKLLPSQKVILGLGRLAPGTYAVVYHETTGVWSAQPAIFKHSTKVRLQPLSALVGQAHTIQVRMTNQGNVQESFRAVIGIGQATHRVARFVVQPGGAHTLRYNWAPKRVGHVQVMVRINGQLIASRSIRVGNVRRSWLFLQSLPTVANQWVLAIILTLLTALVMGSWTWITRSRWHGTTLPIRRGRE